MSRFCFTSWVWRWLAARLEKRLVCVAMDPCSVVIFVCAKNKIPVEVPWGTTKKQWKINFLSSFWFAQCLLLALNTSQLPTSSYGCLASSQDPLPTLPHPLPPPPTTTTAHKATLLLPVPCETGSKALWTLTSMQEESKGCVSLSVCVNMITQHAVTLYLIPVSASKDEIFYFYSNYYYFFFTVYMSSMALLTHSTRGEHTTLT